MASAQLSRMRSLLLRVRAAQIALQSQLLSPSLVAATARFSALTAAFLSSWEGVHSAAAHSPPPRALRMLPEYAVEDMAEVLLVVLAAGVPPQLLEEALADIDAIISFAVVFMAAPQAIKSPYLRAKLVQVLAHFTPYAYQDDRAPPQVLGHLLQNKQAQACMGSALMKLYCGAHSMHYTV